MRCFVILALALFAVAVSGEKCQSRSDCVETSCNYEHGWWLHCTNNICLCSHDSHTGKPCADGQASTCAAVHDSRCSDHGLHWHCLDGTCHCSSRP